MILSPLVLGLGLAIGLLVLLPARRLQLAGWSGRSIGLYALALWLGAMLVAMWPGSRVLVPILLVVFLAPFIAGPVRVPRVFRGAGRGHPPRPPMKDVTPPDKRPR